MKINAHHIVMYIHDIHYIIVRTVYNVQRIRILYPIGYEWITRIFVQFS